jgi:hypothetical protein
MMRAAMLGHTIDEAAAQFRLDSHHLALLDRFVARARRDARRSGRQFSGVMVEVEPARPVRVRAAGQEPLVLDLGAAQRW